MHSKLNLPLLDTAAGLAACNGWTEEVYRDLLAFQRGEMSAEALDAKYLYRTAILTLDLTGFTVAAMTAPPIHSFLRILDAQKVCIPALHHHGSTLVRAFTDDLVALFDDPLRAIDAAFDIHRRVAAFNRSDLASESPPLACIGIGYGNVYRIGPNLSMGDEMNRASKLGEDIARGDETLVTSNVHAAASHRTDLVFERIEVDDQLFPYYRVTAAA